MSDLFSRILSITKKHNLTGREFGKMLGLEKSPLTDWKNGKSKPTLDQIIKICELFAVSADYLLLGIDNLNASALSPNEIELINNYRCKNINITFSSEENQIFLLYKQLLPADQHELLGILKGFAIARGVSDMELPDQQVIHRREA